jgi:hypothetical protein
MAIHKVVVVGVAVGTLVLVGVIVALVLTVGKDNASSETSGVDSDDATDKIVITTTPTTTTKPTKYLRYDTSEDDFRSLIHEAPV